MKPASTYLFAAGALLAALAIVWLALPRAPNSVQESKAETVESGGSGVLDGKTFAGLLGPIGKPGDVKDTLAFTNGNFFSSECDKRCGYPARPYFVRQVGDKIEFVSESHCLYKDAKLVWRGTVDGETIKGLFTWTLNRWYWTIEKEFWFEGTLAEDAGPVASTR